MEIPPRCRKPRAVDYEDAHEVEIREVSEADAPLAIRQFFLNYAGEREEGVLEYRWYDGKLWTDRAAVIHYNRFKHEPRELWIPDKPVQHYRDESREHTIRTIEDWAQNQILIGQQV